MDISCSKSSRHFSSFEALEDCKKSCIDGYCPYLKQQSPSITIPKLNKSSDELNENEMHSLLEIAKESGKSDKYVAKWERIRWKSESDLKELYYRRFRNIHKYQFCYRIT